MDGGGSEVTKLTLEMSKNLMLVYCFVRQVKRYILRYNYLASVHAESLFPLPWREEQILGVSGWSPARG